jgi:hypothetical protein
MNISYMNKITKLNGNEKVKVTVDTLIIPVAGGQEELSHLDSIRVTLTIIKSEDYGYAEGFGFIVEDNRTVAGTKLLQATIGGVAGNQVYDTELKAYLNGLLVVYGVRNATTEVSPETLRYIKVIN